MAESIEGVGWMVLPEQKALLQVPGARDDDDDGGGGDALPFLGSLISALVLAVFFFADGAAHSSHVACTQPLPGLMPLTKG